MNREAAEKRGRGAETIACWWLRLHGWRILAVRARTPVGEVDLIARRFRTVAFIEVKSRATNAKLDLAIDRHASPASPPPPNISLGATQAHATISVST